MNRVFDYPKSELNKIKKQGTLCRSQDYTEMELYRAFRPFLLSLKLCGLNFTKDYKISAKNCKHKIKIPCHQKYTISAVYCTITLFGMVFNLIRLAIGILHGKSLTDMLQASIYICWLLICNVNALSCFIGYLQVLCPS